MLNKILIGASLLLSTSLVQASLIEYNGYSRDSNSNNIVTGGGLEWLMWDVTKGLSINSALSTYATQGWRLASNDEMASLFNSFRFGRDDWVNSEISYQYSDVPRDLIENASPHAFFISLFGITYTTSCSTSGVDTGCYSDTDPAVLTRGVYGSDANGNGFYNYASVRDDSLWINTVGHYSPYDHLASLHSDDFFGSDVSRSWAGVALVRSFDSGPVSVPNPGSIGLLTLGLVALGYRRRQVLVR